MTLTKVLAFGSARRRGALRPQSTRARQSWWGDREAVCGGHWGPAVEPPSGHRRCACQAQHLLTERRGHDPLRRCSQAVCRLSAGQLCAERRLPWHTRWSVEQNQLRYHAQRSSHYTVMTRILLRCELALLCRWQRRQAVAMLTATKRQQPEAAGLAARQQLQDCRKVAAGVALVAISVAMAGK